MDKAIEVLMVAIVAMAVAAVVLGLFQSESSDVGSNLSELQEGASDDLKCETLRANYGFADTASKKQEIASKIQELEGCNIPNENSNQQGSAP